MPGRRGGAYSDGKALQTRIAEIQLYSFIELSSVTFQQMKEGHRVEVLEALRQVEPVYYTVCKPVY